MRYTVLLPPQTASNDEVFLVAEWHKEIGEMVAEGNPLVVLRAGETEIVFLSPCFGILTRKLVLPGSAIEVGEPLAVLSGVSDALLQAASEISTAFSLRPPYVPHGPGDVVVLSPREQAVAAHHARSLYTIPHVSTVARVDVTEAVRLADRLSADLFPLVLCAVAHALHQFPALNAERAGDEEIRRKRYVHLGFPVYENGALIAVPVVRDADKKSVRAVVEEWGELGRAAHAQTLSFDSQRGATFTVSQAAPGALYQNPIIAAPQAAALCVGAVARVPAVVQDGNVERVEIRSVLYLCLSHDARVSEEQTAGAFLADICTNLEETHFLFAG